ncbi:MAG: hypothetical protein AAGL10_03955 [Pseudomonadota bacterium]
MLDLVSAAAVSLALQAAPAGAVDPLSAVGIVSVCAEARKAEDSAATMQASGLSPDTLTFPDGSTSDERPGEVYTAEWSDTLLVIITPPIREGGQKTCLIYANVSGENMSPLVTRMNKSFGPVTTSEQGAQWRNGNDLITMKAVGRLEDEGRRLSISVTEIGDQ